MNIYIATVALEQKKKMVVCDVIASAAVTASTFMRVYM
jgi:hypothetical protein